MRHVTRLGTDIYSFGSTIQTPSRSCFSNSHHKLVLAKGLKCCLPTSTTPLEKRKSARLIAANIIHIFNDDKLHCFWSLLPFRSSNTGMCSELPSEHSFIPYLPNLSTPLTNETDELILYCPSFHSIIISLLPRLRRSPTAPSPSDCR